MALRSPETPTFSSMLPLGILGKDHSVRTAFPRLHVSLPPSALPTPVTARASPRGYLHALSPFSHLPRTPQVASLALTTPPGLLHAATIFWARQQPWPSRAAPLLASTLSSGEVLRRSFCGPFLCTVSSLLRRPYPMPMA